MGIRLNQENINGFVQDREIEKMLPAIQKAHNDLAGKTGAGSEYTGWMDLAGRIERSFLDELLDLGAQVQKRSDCIVSIGIGGSYLGIRSTVEYVRNKVKIPIYYAGHNICADYIQDLIATIKDKDVTVVVISKSGTTTEPALAFRLIKQFMQSKYGEEELAQRIICVTDQKKGALRQIADAKGYRSFVIPDDVGGRFSVLTPVGLVPLALAGVDIVSLIEGAVEGEKLYGQMDLEKNIAYRYAAIRNILFQEGRVIEVLSSFSDNMVFVGEWWKQLFGESEGKNGKGIFPASLVLTTDLHSMGQLMQEGVRNMFETFLVIEKSENKVVIPEEKENLDNFNYVAGKDLDFVNTQAYKATSMAHFEGGVPNMTLSLAKPDVFHLGQLYYFFEKVVGISGYLSGVNPFNQPGVEAYKKKMFALLGKK